MVEGRFAPLPYAALNADQAAFLEVFLRARGNLREVERVLGLSYPTVRGRLDAVLAVLGLGGEESAGGGLVEHDGGAGRREVLAALQRGEISAAEAVSRLRPAE